MKRNDHYIVKIISACLMGDGHLRKDDHGNRNRNAHLRIKQIEQHKDHLDYIANAISPITSTKYDYIAPKDSVVICGKNTRASGYYQIRTQNHPFFTDLYRRWYLNKIKVIDPHCITLLDAEFLAIWYMQDGYLQAKRKDCINRDIVLCTDCFSYGDLSMMRRGIVEKTGFVFNIRNHTYNTNNERTYRMYLYRKQTPEFVEYISPFIQDSFSYKISLNNVEHPILDEDIVCSSQ